MARRTRGLALIAAAVAAGAAPLAVALVLAIGVVATDVPAAGAQGCRPQLSVSRTAGLAAAGETVTVSGSCYDLDKGIYVAFCVVPPPGAVPSPCGGGVDMSGANGLSHWISSNPPPQGVGLTTPYGPGGSFTVTMRPSSQLNASVDCLRTSCAIVTRNDHTRSSDRSQDVVVPVSFVAPPPAPVTTVPAPVATAPPTTAPPVETTTTLPPEETTTTSVADTTTSTSSTTVALDEGDTDELAAAPASSSSSGSGGGTAIVVVVVVLLLGVGGGGTWWVLHRRATSAGASGGGA